MSIESRSIADDYAAILGRLEVIEQLAREALRFGTEKTRRLNAADHVPDEAVAAMRARAAATTRGHFKVSEFAAVIGRHRQWVSDRCAARVIRTLKGGKPYRIPLEEESRWNGLDEKGGR